MERPVTSEAEGAGPLLHASLPPSPRCLLPAVHPFRPRGLPGLVLPLCTPCLRATTPLSPPRVLQGPRRGAGNDPNHCHSGLCARRALRGGPGPSAGAGPGWAGRGEGQPRALPQRVRRPDLAPARGAWGLPFSPPAGEEGLRVDDPRGAALPAVAAPDSVSPRASQSRGKRPAGLLPPRARPLRPPGAGARRRWPRRYQRQAGPGLGTRTSICGPSSRVCGRPAP